MPGLLGGSGLAGGGPAAEENYVMITAIAQYKLPPACITDNATGTVLLPEAAG